MPILDLKLECPIHRDFQVDAVAGMFDVPLEKRATREIRVEYPDLGGDWRIGAIVGPSGSGKTSVARALGAAELYRTEDNPWPADKAVISSFGKASVKDVARTLTAVGFSSPPSWVKPYAILSNGEKFRCDLARALLASRPRVWFDEFTSVVDRTVAQVGSAAVAKSLRSGHLPIEQFVAVTCHYDVLDWLCPDWVVDMATCTLARGCLRRPDITLEVVRADRAAWKLFAKHHYLDAGLHRSAQCFMALWRGEPVAFCGMLANFGWKDFWRIARIVCLPDYQGVGIGTRVMEGVASLYRRDGKRVSIVASNPAVVRHCERSPLWSLMAVKKTGNMKHTAGERAVSAGRAVVSFEYVGPPAR